MERERERDVPAKLIRMSRKVGNPTAAVMRLTCLFFPSERIH